MTTDGEFSYFKKMFKTAHVDDLTSNEVKETALSTGDVFTNVVHRLEDIDLPPISDLMKLFSKLVGNRVVPVGMVNGFTKTLSFYAEVGKGKMMATILCPDTWIEMVQADPCLQMGAMVFVASQARDFYNNKFKEAAMLAVMKRKTASDSDPEVIGDHGDDNPVTIRARAYEAEFLHWVKRNEPSHVFEKYQRKLIDENVGLKSIPPDMAYESMPFPRPWG